MLMSRINNSPPLCWYIGDCRYILDHSYKSQWNQDFSPRYINAHLNFGPSLSLSFPDSDVRTTAAAVYPGIYLCVLYVCASAYKGLSFVVCSRFFFSFVRGRFMGGGLNRGLSESNMRVLFVLPCFTVKKRMFIEEYYTFILSIF